MAQLATQVCSRATPLSATFAAATAGGDNFSAGDNIFLHAKNTGGSVCTVTVATPGNIQGIALQGFQFTVPATSGDVEVGPFPADLFGETAQITYSQVTSVTIACIQYGE